MRHCREAADRGEARRVLYSRMLFLPAQAYLTKVTTMFFKMRMLSLCYVNVIRALFDRVFGRFCGFFRRLWADLTSGTRRHPGRSVGRNRFLPTDRHEVADVILCGSIAREQSRQLFAAQQTCDSRYRRQSTVSFQ